MRMFLNNGVPEVRENISYSVIMFKLIKQKPYRLGLLFTHDNGALSKMERRFTASILKVDHHISDRCNSIVSIVAHVKPSKRGSCLTPLVARVAFFLARV